jgi:hypothetical protein
MPFCPQLYKSKAPAVLWMLFFFCILVSRSNAAPADTLTKITTVKEIYFPELKQEPGSQDSSSFVLPFSKAGNLLLIKAKADSTEGNFILDTGCPGLVLNVTYFRNYHAITHPEDENLGVTGPAAIAEQIWIRNFHFGTIQEYDVKANLANLGNIENSKGVKVLGLIGMQFLKNCELIIDYQKNLMYFHIIGRKESGSYKNDLLNDTAAYHTIPFELLDSRIIVKKTMAGKKLRFVIDCAAETNILDSRLPDKIFETLSITGKVSLIGVGNTKVEAVKGSLASFNIGNRIIIDMPVLVTNLEKTCFSQGGCVDGVLGLDNLSVKKIGFNFTTLKMYIWK